MNGAANARCSGPPMDPLAPSRAPAAAGSDAKPRTASLSPPADLAEGRLWIHRSSGPHRSLRAWV